MCECVWERESVCVYLVAVDYGIDNLKGLSSYIYRVWVP